jgi:IS30 family transposase
MRRRKSRYGWFKPGDIAEIWRRMAAGDTFVEAGAALGCSPRSVERVVRQQGGIAPRAARPRSPLRLRGPEREEISRGLPAGESIRSIARRLGRDPSTVSREVARNGGRVEYRAAKATIATRERERRPKVARLARQPRLRAEVERLLELDWSPRQIARRLPIDHPDDREMRVSHETIYASLYVQARGALRRELAAHLRTGRSRRRVEGTATGVGQIRDMVNISARPPEASDRAVPGNWEGDLIVGKGSRSQVATLVERRSRFVLLAAIPTKAAPEVADVLALTITTVPTHLHRTLTWDQGHEMAAHRQFTAATGIAVYFCDPHSPWQRGTNENTNGLLRQYLPKGMDLSGVTQEQLDFIADRLNGRPRQTLGWRTPSEVFAEAVAPTD